MYAVSNKVYESYYLLSLVTTRQHTSSIYILYQEQKYNSTYHLKLVPTFEWVIVV